MSRELPRIDTTSLNVVLDQLVEITLPADDPTGRLTYEQLEYWRLIRNVADRQIATHAATSTTLASRKRRVRPPRSC